MVMLMWKIIQYIEGDEKGMVLSSHIGVMKHMGEAIKTMMFSMTF